MSVQQKYAQITANNAAILKNVQKVYDAGYSAGQSSIPVNATIKDDVLVITGHTTSSITDDILIVK